MMCGRYYTDDETTKIIEKMTGVAAPGINLGGREDVCPSQKTVVLRAKEGKMIPQLMLWGFPRFDHKGLIINARTEGALEKKSFRESIVRRRCVILARGFYEWNRVKEKFMFEQADGSPLYMAGCFAGFDGEDRFVILTTCANDSVSPVHDRMPLLLNEDEAKAWVLDDGATEFILAKKPAPLKKKTDYEQMCLF